MKKFVLPFFSCLLVLTLLLGSFGSAKAAIGDDPVVTPVSGDTEFTTEIVPIASLPGITELESGMLAPAGFPDGEAQFEGNGVRVNGMDSGKANACFAISGTQYGWGGKVGLWTGTKWELLPTSITSQDEVANSTACATITGSGTYAFIRYVVNPDLLPKLGVCTDSPSLDMILIVPGYGGEGGPFLWLIAAMITHSPVPVDGSHVYYQVLGSDPAGLVTSGGSGYGVTSAPPVPSSQFIVVAPGLMAGSGGEPISIGINPEAGYFNSVDVRVTFPDCFYDFHLTMDDFDFIFGVPD